MSNPTLQLAAKPVIYSRNAHARLLAQASLSLALPSGRDGASLACCEGSCLGYHRGWVLLQHLGIISGLSSERRYIVDAIREVSAQKPIKSVLVAGCADFGLLSVVHEALANEIASVQITAIDRCETPLRLCRLYAERMDFEVSCRSCDLLLDSPPGGFDLVLMHSLMSFCPPDARGRLMEKLAASLAPFGVLLCYQSIRPGVTPVTLAYEEAEIAALIHRMESECSAIIAAAGLLEHVVADHIRAFCHAKKTVSVPSLAGLVGDAEAHGLTVRSCRLLFDSRSSGHRAATPESYYLKYQLKLQPSASACA